MISTWLKIAFRNLSRNKVFSFINIFGLAVGLATCLLIMLYILDERGYDQQHIHADRIYRIASASTQKGVTKERPWAAAAAPIAGGLLSDMPEVEQATRLLKFPTFDKMLLKVEQGKDTKQFYEANGYYVDSTFFRIFTYDFKIGHGADALDEPNSLVISEEIARKLFGRENPVGRTINVGIPYGSFNYTVKGVIRTEGVRSHIPGHFFLSMRNGDIGGWVNMQTNWATNNIFHTYIKLKEGADSKAFEKKLQPFIDRRASPDLKALGVTRQLFMQPVGDIYLHSDLEGEIAPNGNGAYLYILGSIAAFVLLIACINFMNLSTAHSGKRAREVGVRKVMGAEKGALILQFVGESFAISCLALLLALLLAWAFLPVFNRLTQKSLELFGQPRSTLWIAALTVLTGIISGIYPALYLSSFKPIAVLKGKFINSLSAAAVRRGLVVFQFTVSICLVLGAIIIGKQLSFMENRQLGFQKDQQVVIPLQNLDAVKHYGPLKDELLKQNGIKSITGGSTYPGIPNAQDMLYYAEGKTVNDAVDIHLATVEGDYFSTLGITLLYGRTFPTEHSAADSNSIILNETSLKELGYTPKTAVGRKLYFDYQGGHHTMQIVGVVRDFNFESLYHSIKPFGFQPVGGNNPGYLIASLAAGNYGSRLKDMEAAWNRINPHSPFVYSFLDKDFQKNYESEQRAAAIVTYFTGFAILIASLGLFGLSAFTAEQRIKEIGIRKVLGASVTNVAALLCADFIRLVLIAIVIASALAWVGMNKWLQNFAYQIEIRWWMFAAAGLMAIFIAMFTVSFQAIRAAVANPAKSLRTE